MDDAASGKNKPIAAKGAKSVKGSKFAGWVVRPIT
jgi:hypothetical protein